LHRIGVWVDGAFSWLSSTEWEIKINYEPETLVSHIEAKNDKLGIALTFTDVIYNEQDVFIRQVKVKNRSNNERDIRIFFNQQFRIDELDHGNTGYYDPEIEAIIHYRGRRVFLVSGSMNSTPFNEYSVGIFAIEGRDGTWKDAEDGSLSKNPIEHGNVDSTISFIRRAKPQEEYVINYWVIAAETIPVAKGINRFLQIKTIDHVIRTTRDYWHAWVNKVSTDFGDLDPALIALFKKSLLIIRTHVDNRGAIIASGDTDILQYGRDTYSYMWPRDAAITAQALDDAGYHEVTNKFFEFCNDVLSEEGYLLHKYRPDKSIGSSWHPWVYGTKRQLAIQEDETALVLYSLWNHYQNNKDLEFIERIYNSFIKKTADFLYFYLDDKTRLPYGSYDLWEEKFGTSTYTASTVYAGLIAASNFAHILGKDEESKKYYSGAKSVQEGIIRYLYNKETGYFYKLIDIRNNTIKVDATIDISNFYGPFRFGVCTPDDPILLEAYKTIENHLCCNVYVGEIGGAVRYVGDNYHRIDANTPGNPWVITTLWLTQYRIAQAKTKKELSQARDDLRWVANRALSSGILSEQIHPHTGEQLSVAPLIWSHSEFVLTVLQYIKKEKAVK
jgi:GH15 family glucan-1,4-alpha-glucosidase